MQIKGPPLSPCAKKYGVKVNNYTELYSPSAKISYKNTLYNTMAFGISFMTVSLLSKPFNIINLLRDRYRVRVQKTSPLIISKKRKALVLYSLTR